MLKTSSPSFPSTVLISSPFASLKWMVTLPHASAPAARAGWQQRLTQYRAQDARRVHAAILHHHLLCRTRKMGSGSPAVLANPRNLCGVWASERALCKGERAHACANHAL
jgi:hypothetical protein